MPVWSNVEDKLKNFSHRLNDLDQYMKKNTLKILGLTDIPSKTHGLAFSEYVLRKLKELLPSISDKLRLEDIDVSHPLPTKSKTSKTCIIVKFVRRDIKNLIFFKKRELKLSSPKIVIIEHLTAENRWYLDEARRIVGYKNAWSSQCIVYALTNGRKCAIRSIQDLDDIYRAHNSRNSGINNDERNPPPPSHFYISLCVCSCCSC